MIERLEELDLQKPIHFIGIGGSGMSNLALALRSMGYVVSGSDINDGGPLDRLRGAGAAVAVGHNGGNIASGAQLVVASAAIKKDNPEWMAAEVRGIPVVKYARMLGVLMRSRRGIAVAGTHGKTTTAGMVAVALRELGADPAFVIGGEVPQLGGGAGLGSSDYLVAEACEFDRSFLSLWPRYAIINNIEEDHLDYYSGLEEIVGAFRDFALRLPPDGLLVYGASSVNTARFIREVPCRTIACALEREADYWAHDIRYEQGRSLYRLRVNTPPPACGGTGMSGTGILPVEHGQEVDAAPDDGRDARPTEPDSCNVALSVFGRHNVINSLGAIALLHQIGFPLLDVARAVGTFRGVRRRFEIVHDRDGICIVDDYAHHPTEVQTVLKSSKTYFAGRRVIAVFQPHQHSRTRFLLKDFARSFQYADLVVVPDIYFVRDSEKEREMVHARDLVREIVAHGGNAIYLPSFAEIEQFLINNINRGDVLLTMGAGDVWQIGARLAKRMTALSET